MPPKNRPVDKNKVIIVLNDGETFTSLENCQVIELTEAGMEAVNQDIYPKHLTKKHIASKVSIETVLDFYTNQ